MIKADLVKLVAIEAGISRVLAKQIIELAIQNIICALAVDHHVQLLGFGTFFLKRRKGRLLKLPLSELKIELPDCYVIKFVPGKRFLHRLNK